MKPVRVQRSRKKGAKLPPNTVCVSRPSIFGNPFVVASPGKYEGNVLDARGRILTASHAEAVEAFEWWLDAKTDQAAITLLSHIPRLRGKNLACWCPLDKPCHADILLTLANFKPARRAR